MLKLKLESDTSKMYLVKGGNTKITCLGVIKQLVSGLPVNSLTNRYGMKSFPRSVLKQQLFAKFPINPHQSRDRASLGTVKGCYDCIYLFVNFCNLFITQIILASEVKFCFISIILVNSPGYLFHTTINRQIFKLLHFVFVRPDYCSIGGAVS